MKGSQLADDSVLLPDGDIPPPWPPRKIVIDDAMLHVRDPPPTTASAEPAVYVHGLGGSSQNFTDVAGLLADRFDGQAVDLPGVNINISNRSETPGAPIKGRMLDHIGFEITGLDRVFAIHETREDAVSALDGVSQPSP